MSNRLEGKVAVITGSTTGIGEAIARRFRAEGATVVIHGRDLDRGNAVAAQLGAPQTAVFVQADLREPAACDALISAAAGHFGGIDILVNNAAYIVRGDIDSTSMEDFDRAIAVNVRAPLRLIQACLPHFRAIGSGRVINIGSINAYCGERNQVAYATSKGALMTLTRNLSDALGHEGIRVNQFNVGWVLTQNEYQLKQTDGLPADWPQRLSKTDAPAGRLISPEEIASFAVAFADDEGGPISGAVVDLNQYPMIGRNPTKGVA